jgi:hypothetical protein
MTVHPLLASVGMLCRANLGILNQKLLLMDVMRSSFGASQSRELYQQVCPIVRATIGQHIRHSMDHIELATAAASPENRQIHYDIRSRGGPDEHDIDHAQIRIEQVVNNLTKLAETYRDTTFKPVQACFLLSGDPQEFQMTSTVERELGFCAHHAIHHMAMVKIIAVETLQIPPEALSPDFGKAPSTIVYDGTRSQATPS